MSGCERIINEGKMPDDSGIRNWVELGGEGVDIVNGYFSDLERVLGSKKGVISPSLSRLVDYCERFTEGEQNERALSLVRESFEFCSRNENVRAEKNYPVLGGKLVDFIIRYGKDDESRLLLEEFVGPSYEWVSGKVFSKEVVNFIFKYGDHYDAGKLCIAFNDWGFFRLIKNNNDLENNFVDFSIKNDTEFHSGFDSFSFPGSLSLRLIKNKALEEENVRKLWSFCESQLREGNGPLLDAVLEGIEEDSFSERGELMILNFLHEILLDEEYKELMQLMEEREIKKKKEMAKKEEKYQRYNDPDCLPF